jgi:hypothetical protein
LAIHQTPNKEAWWRQRKEAYYTALVMSWEEGDWTLSSFSAIFGVQTWAISLSRQGTGGRGQRYA